MAIIPNGQQILTSSSKVDTTYSGPASLKGLNTWYTMEDIKETVAPYKKLVLTNISYSTGEGVPYNYTVAENTFTGNITLTIEFGYLRIYFEELVGINVDTAKLYLTGQNIFSPSPLNGWFDPNLEESGITSGGGYVYFVNCLADGSSNNLDLGNLEIRVYN